CSCQLTENAPEETEDGEGVARTSMPLAGVGAPGAAPTRPCDPCRSSSSVADQAGSPMAPVCPATVAVALSKLACPKSASRSVLQLPAVRQADGASTIQSAEEASMRDARRVLAKRAPVVRLRMRSVTRLPLTVTDAETCWPGSTLSARFTGGAGSSSNHVE